MGFGSDNHSGVHPRVLDALIAANSGHVSSYGADPFTEKAQEMVKEQFGDQAQVFFVLTGTGANVLSVQASCRSFEAVIATDAAHLYCDECGAVERMTGCRVATVPHQQGKLSPEGLLSQLKRVGDVHSSQPRLVSITQSTELGTVYQPDEIKALAEITKSRNLFLHVDGARLSNAAAALECRFADITAACGVDLVSLGGTKNGMMVGEAVVVLNPALGESFPWYRKQSMQLASKMRYISAQFSAWLEDDLWRKNALNANRMAQRLATGASQLEQVEILYPVEANEIFARLPRQWIDPLVAKYNFYEWEASLNQVRWVTSWDTQEQDVDALLHDMQLLASS
ncbi:threonine aldolase family protein [Pseudobacteriovorax antillogorgiicola]|uniref:L-threonine aldolase n=1 Tax=Pseudobacteriovorax antillogorgiicola TaxID=1513793 RepID=A0A1Y6CGA3_9BACT|nr:low specificity L-threonine aldolase [Pseudobacteriovorax antillogorgiicola]TCS48702.1 L-threonine aldolase [Pseudobacteriovorax antillogorgiicola]SMF54708.1 L-threonine aldolase [Pseudobacteriovorax antillogorgiicola]